MAMVSSAFAIAQPALLLWGKEELLRNAQTLPSLTFASRRRNYVAAANAIQNGSESSTGSIVKYVKNAWNSSEDRIALAGLGFAAVAALWASTNLIGTVDKLPLVPSAFEFIGILFSWWFIYRYLLFKPDREELLRNIKGSLSRILGQ